jgi:regulatory protein
MEDFDFQSIYHKLARFCSYQERFESDVLNKAKKLGIVQYEQQQQLIERLKKEKFLDQRRAIQCYVNSKIFTKKWSKIKVAYFLINKHKVCKECVEEILNQIDDEKYIAIVKKKVFEKIKKFHNLSNKEKKEKVLGLLMQEGFEKKYLNHVWDKLYL